MTWKIGLRYFPVFPLIKILIPNRNETYSFLRKQKVENKKTVVFHKYLNIFVSSLYFNQIKFFFF